MKANKFIGWIMAMFSIAATLGIGFSEASLTHGALWFVLAKLFWVHADIKHILTDRHTESE